MVGQPVSWIVALVSKIEIRGELRYEIISHGFQRVELRDIVRRHCWLWKNSFLAGERYVCNIANEAHKTAKKS